MSSTFADSLHCCVQTYIPQCVTSAGNPLSLCIRYFLLNVLHCLKKPPDSVDYLKFAKWAQHFMQSEVSPPAGPVVHTSQHRWECFSADGSVTDTENNLAG